MYGSIEIVVGTWPFLNTAYTKNLLSDLIPAYVHTKVQGPQSLRVKGRLDSAYSRVRVPRAAFGVAGIVQGYACQELLLPSLVLIPLMPVALPVEFQGK